VAAADAAVFYSKAQDGRGGSVKLLEDRAELINDLLN
jgi:hypothetical protein